MLKFNDDGYEGATLDDVQIDLRTEPAESHGQKPIAFARPAMDDVDKAAVLRTLESGWITTGPECAKFEEELASYLGASHVITASSATTAEEICLAYLGEPKGRRIGVPTWTFASSALAIHRTGHIPVLLDVDPDDLNVSAESLKQAILHGGLDGLVGVHFAGNAVNAEIREICATENMDYIEDAAHALGTSDERGLIRGSDGTLAAFYSFYATKNLPMGEGGAIATDDAQLAEFARTYRLHGMSADAVNRYASPGKHQYDIIHPGIKANLSDLHATIGRSQLARFEKTQAKRRDLVERYRENLGGIEELRFVPGDRPEGSSDHLAVIQLPTVELRDKVISHLADSDVGSSVHFIPLHTFSWFAKNVDIGPSGVGNADAAAGCVMSLPLHAGLTIGDVDRVSDLVSEAVSAERSKMTLVSPLR